FWNAQSGGFGAARELVSAGGEESFEVPAGGDVVLFVSAQARPRRELRLRAAWRDDWDGVSTGAVRAGEIGVGDRAEVGVFDGVTWSGGHSTEGQYPPSG